MMESLARTSYRRRRTVVLAWLVLLVGAIVVNAAFGGDLRTVFRLEGSESQEAFDLLEEGGFAGNAGERGQIVFAAEEGVEAPEVRAAVEELFARAEAEVTDLSIVSPYQTGGRQISADATVAFAEVEFGDVPFNTAMSRAEEIVTIGDDVVFPDGVRVEFGGEPFYEEHQFSSEAFGLLAAVVILLVAFGSVLAMSLPIVTALFAIGTGLTIVFLAARGLDIPDFAPAAVAMITIGVGIDYSLFIVTRYREEIAAGRDPEGAVVRAVTTAGRAVLFAGTTVIIALLGLFVIGLDAVRALAISICAGVLMVMLASLTLLPAMLGFTGRNIDRLSVGRRRFDRGGRESIWYRWARLVQRRPGRVAAVGFAVILVLTAPVFSMRLGFSDAGNLPSGNTAREAYDLLSDSFGPGFNGPLFLAVDLSGDPEVDAAVLAELHGVLDADAGVAFVAPPMTNGGGDVAVVQAFPTTSPQAEETAELVGHLRDETIPSVVAATDVEVLVGGSVAVAADVSEYQASRLPIFIGVVLAVSLVVLMAVFRSVPVAIKAVVLNLLSIGAAYGILVAVFQWGWGLEALGLGEPGPIEAWAPMMLFAVLFGLSMDYEVFLLSRIKEEFDRTRDNARAVAGGLARTARLITAAAAIMICVFGGFVVSDERALQLFGFGLAIAIFVDVTVVRLLLVPSTMELLGDANWWLPRWLDRLLPRLTVKEWVEPAVVHAATSGDDALARTPTLGEPVGTPGPGRDA